ncbi:MAG: VIT1/CCC1 family protein [Myxococcales bacterium]
MDQRTDLWLQNLRDERDGAALYEGLATLEKNPKRAQSFRELALSERRHAELWAKKLGEAGVALPPEQPSPRVRLTLWLAKRLGVAAVLTQIVETETVDADKYSRQGADAAQLVQEEREHSVLLNEMKGESAGASEGAAGAIAVRERWHKGGRAGSLRAAVFGMNDGLVSNLSLVLGVAAAGANDASLVVTGLAGLLAGACSMAAGEYTSVASQRDLLQRQIELERRELAEAPKEEAAELALIFERKGLSAEQVGRTTSELLKNPEAALDTLVREELGLDPADLGSPLGAALSSFATFAVGAVVPILPFLFAKGWLAVGLACGFAGALLVAVGAFLGVLSGTGAVKSAARMLGLAALAAGVTFGLGRLVGSTLG